MTIELHQGDCLEILPTLPAASVDAIITDPPYGTTACKWDAVIPFEPMWKEIKRVIKPRGAIVLFGSQPFTSALVLSNPEWFRYAMVWDKVNKFTDFMNAKRRPMRRHEDLLVFASGSSTYNPQLDPVKPWKSRRKGRPVEFTHAGKSIDDYGRMITTRNPSTIISVPGHMTTGIVHPTQKPLPLMERLVKTYTNEGETVLDFTMGSGTAGVACVNTGRNFIGIERDPNYFAIAEKRIAEAATPAPLFAAV
jgi:DNA modification methylase